MESDGLRWREADVAPSFRAKKFLNETVIGNAKSNPKRRIKMEVNRLCLLPSRTTASLLLGLPPTRLSLAPSYSASLLLASPSYSRTTGSLLLGFPPTRLSLLLPYYGLPPTRLPSYSALPPTRLPS